MDILGLKVSGDTIILAIFGAAGLFATIKVLSYRVERVESNMREVWRHLNRHSDVDSEIQRDVGELRGEIHGISNTVERISNYLIGKAK